MVPEDCGSPSIRKPRGGRHGVSVIDPRTIEQLQRHLPNQSKETVMDVLGISQQTWTKLKRGEPVRTVLIERAMRRLDIEGWANRI